MSLQAWLARIEQLHPAEIELGLGRVGKVARDLGVTRFDCPVITVGGTNGKGSCIALADALARGCGLKVGVYTSPHLHRFNERIVVDGRPASDASLVNAFEQVDSVRGDTPLTYFEFTTLAGLWLFGQQPLDLLLLEVGLGGRLDAVNVLDADVSVLTSIGLDHTDWLGDTREEICAEKWGIGRSGRPLLFADPEPPANVPMLARDSGVVLFCGGTDFSVSGESLHWCDNAQARVLHLPEDVPLGRDNLCTALQALACAGISPPEPVIRAVAEQCRVPGRHQRVDIDGVPWVFDVGHNREALWRFSEHLAAVEGDVAAICGMLADKPAARAMAAFADRVSHWHLCTLGGSRGQSADTLARALPEGAKRQCYDDPAAAVQAVRSGPAVSQVLVFGSFLMLDAVAQSLGVDLVRLARGEVDDSTGH